MSPAKAAIFMPGYIKRLTDTAAPCAESDNDRKALPLVKPEQHVVLLFYLFKINELWKRIKKRKAKT